MTACPYCAEPVEVSDGKCKSCGEFLDGRELLHQGGGSTLKTVLIVIGSVLALGAGLCLLLGLAVGFAGKKAQAQARQARVQADFAALQSACKLYKQQKGAYPAQLSDLWFVPGTNIRWNHAYLATPLPTDPWNNPYTYTLQGNVPVITSFGADGAPGGTGDAADLSSGGP